jgi:hypothetical protein
MSSQQIGCYSVYARENSPYWWMVYWDFAEGGRVWKSSKQRRDDPSGYKHALDLARRLAEDGEAGARQSVTSAWDTWVTDHLDLRYHDRSRTLAAELHRWRWIRAFLEERKIRVPAAVTYQHGIDFMAWRQKHKTRKGHGGHNNALQELKLLGRIMREAVRRGYVHASPLERMSIPKHRVAEKPEMTDAEIAAIRAELEKREGALPLPQRWMTISFEIALHQGCRIAETSIPLDRIDLNAGTVTILQKGSRLFTTRLHDALRPMITDLQRAGAKVTCILPARASIHWHLFFHGRPERGIKPVAKRLCFHCTRVTVITRLARSGVPISQAMAYVGHADETIHRIYQRLAAPDLAACSAALAF